MGDAGSKALLVYRGTEKLRLTPMFIRLRKSLWARIA